MGVRRVWNDAVIDREALESEWLEVSRELWDERTGHTRYWELRERMEEIEDEIEAEDRYEMLKAFAP